MSDDGKTVSVTFTPAAAAYSAGDIMDVAKNFAFPEIRNPVEFVIKDVSLLIAHTAVISGETSYRLHLYNGAPPSGRADNAAWDLAAADRSVYLGYVDLGTPVDNGTSLYVETLGVMKQIRIPAGGAVYGELVTNGAFTATAADRIVTMHGFTL